MEQNIDKVILKELSAELWSDFEAYFEFKGKCSGCWCMNHRLPVGLNFEGEAAKLSMKQLIQSNRVFGVLAYAEKDRIPIGWCSVDRRKTLPGHDCIGDDIACSPNRWSIHCVTTREDYKNHGLEVRLVEAAVELVRNLNGRSVEIYPEPNSSPGKAFKTWNTFSGYESDVEKLGFRRIEKDFGKQAEFYRSMIRFLDQKVEI